MNRNGVGWANQDLPTKRKNGAQTAFAHPTCWQLPADDARFDLRWRIIKANFSRYFEANIERSTSKAQKREKGIWQRRYWEHLIRDERDLNQHIDYVHANPVKHGHVTNAKDWPYSSFHRYVQEGVLPVDWMGSMDDAKMPLGE